jgi:hypothetical protein
MCLLYHAILVFERLDLVLPSPPNNFAVKGHCIPITLFEPVYLRPLERDHFFAIQQLIRSIRYIPNRLGRRMLPHLLHKHTMQPCQLTSDVAKLPIPPIGEALASLVQAPR